MGQEPHCYLRHVFGAKSSTENRRAAAYGTKRKFAFEPLEPRILLNASETLPWTAAI